MDFLTLQAREALHVLTASNGRHPYAIFIRQFGDIRDMGAGKRDRERPHLKPATTSESLFYHALIARAFFDTDQGPQEFAYIPDDLFELVSQRISESQGTNDKETPLINEAMKQASLQAAGQRRAKRLIPSPPPTAFSMMPQLY